MEMRRCTSWVLAISKEKRATGLPKSLAALRVTARNERGFPHARPGGNDDQIRRLPPRGDAVQIGKTGWRARQAVFFADERLDLFEHFGRERAHALVGTAEVVLGDGEQALFGVVEEVEDVGGVLVGVFDGAGADADEFALDVFLGQDAWWFWMLAAEGRPNWLGVILITHL